MDVKSMALLSSQFRGMFGAVRDSDSGLPLLDLTAPGGWGFSREVVGIGLLPPWRLCLLAGFDISARMNGTVGLCTGHSYPQILPAGHRVGRRVVGVCRTGVVVAFGGGRR